MRRVTRPADTLRMVLTDISKDASDTWWMPVGWMMCTIRHTNLLKIKRAYSFQAGDVDPILARVGATLVVGINTALRAEIMFCRAGVKLIVVRFSAPERILIPSISADTATAPRIRQNEQLQRRAVCRPFVSLTWKRTAPQ